MGSEAYRSAIAKQLKTGIISVRCGCNAPATDFKTGSPTCELCKIRDAAYEYNNMKERQYEPQPEHKPLC